MKAVLALIYQGEISSQLLKKEPLPLLAVACECDLDALKTLAENSCIRSLKADTVKSMCRRRIFMETLL